MLKKRECTKIGKRGKWEKIHIKLLYKITKRTIFNISEDLCQMWECNPEQNKEKNSFLLAFNKMKRLQSEFAKVMFSLYYSVTPCK